MPLCICMVMFHAWSCFMHGRVFPKEAWQLIQHQPCHTASTLSTWLAPSLAATHAATHTATHVCGHPGRVGEGEQQDVICCLQSNKMSFVVFRATRCRLGRATRCYLFVKMSYVVFVLASVHPAHPMFGETVAGMQESGDLDST